VILHRCFAWSERAGEQDPDGPLWFPREYQGEGRHDNPDVYGCLYVADREASAVVEQLSRFRTQRLIPGMLERRGLPLSLAALELDDKAELLDLDDPRTLTKHALRPSVVATRNRTITQPQALELYERLPEALGLRWWSIHESLWTNVTLFDRALAHLRLAGVRRLEPGDSALAEAVDSLGMPT
jgi:RES domain-containing protein